MVQQHLGIWMVNPYLYAPPFRAAFVIINMTGGLAAPLFVTLAGVSAELGASRNTSFPKMLFRGVILILLGFLLNLMTPSWFSPGSFYVLHLLGVWLLLVPLVLRMSKRVLLMLGLGLLAGGIIGQSWLETPPSLNNEMMRDMSKAGGALRLALWEGHFPLFPWLALAVGGAWAGRAIKAGRAGLLLVCAGVCLGVALVLRCLVLVAPTIARELPFRAACRLGPTFYPLTTVYALSLFSLCLAVLAAFLWFERRGLITSKSWLTPLGQTSLSLLVFHVVFFREGLLALGLRKTIDPVLAIAVIITFLAAWIYLARRWRRIGYRFGLEWLVRRAG